MNQLNMKKSINFSIVTIDQEQQINFFKLINIEHNKNINQIMSITKKKIFNQFFSQFSIFNNFDQ